MKAFLAWLARALVIACLVYAVAAALMVQVNAVFHVFVCSPLARPGFC